jgi:hypothetical protein
LQNRDLVGGQSEAERKISNVQRQRADEIITIRALPLFGIDAMLELLELGESDFGQGVFPDLVRTCPYSYSYSYSYSLLEILKSE